MIKMELHEVWKGEQMDRLEAMSVSGRDRNGQFLGGQLYAGPA
jgi:hypothetical protein